MYSPAELGCGHAAACYRPENLLPSCAPLLHPLEGMGMNDNGHVEVSFPTSRRAETSGILIKIDFIPGFLPSASPYTAFRHLLRRAQIPIRAPVAERRLVRLILRRRLDPVDKLPDLFLECLEGLRRTRRLHLDIERYLVPYEPDLLHAGTGYTSRGPAPVPRRTDSAARNSPR